MKVADYKVKVYSKAIVTSRTLKQTTGGNNDYFITIEQLEEILQSEDK